MSYPTFAETISIKLSENAYALILLWLFIVSRLSFYLLGGAFIATPLSFAMQYLDPVLLKNDLLKSLLYLHSQPPLFNCFLGIVLKLSLNPPIAYDFLFKTAGALIPLLFYGILTSLSVNRFLAFLITVVFMLNPTLILYENLLYYTYIEAFFVLLSIYLLVRWCRVKRFYNLFMFWISLFCLGMIRSLFHPFFFIFIAITLTLYVQRLFAEKRITRIFSLSSLLVLILISFICLKNFIFFGFFGTSSWDGMNLWTKVNGFGQDQLEVFYSQGLISPLALKADLKAFQPITVYFDDATLKTIPCHHPADCKTIKSTGYPNFNHAGYVSLSRYLWKDALHLIAYRPSLFVFYTAGSYSLTLWHSSDSVHALFKNNMVIVKRLETLYRFLYFGFLGVESKIAEGVWGRTIVVTVLFIIVYANTLINLLRKDSHISPEIAVVCLFCLIIHAYTLAVSSIIEFGENNRFRFPVDSAFLILIIGNIVIWRMRRGVHSMEGRLR